MKFEELAQEYYDTFGEFVPVLSTLDVNNEEYLGEVKKAIERKESIDRDYLGEIFMKDKEALY